METWTVTPSRDAVQIGTALFVASTNPEYPMSLGRARQIAACPMLAYALEAALKYLPADCRATPYADAALAVFNGTIPKINADPTREDSYRISVGAAYCRFTLSDQRPRFVTSYSGTVWPDAFPQVFEVGEAASVSGGGTKYKVRDGVRLPERG